MDRNHYFFIGSVFNFSIESKSSCMDKFCVFVYMLMRDMSLKTKDSVYNTHLNFRSFFSAKKVRIIHR